MDLHDQTHDATTQQEFSFFLYTVIDIFSSLCSGGYFPILHFATTFIWLVFNSKWKRQQGEWQQLNIAMQWNMTYSEHSRQISLHSHYSRVHYLQQKQTDNNHLLTADIFFSQLSTMHLLICLQLTSK